LVVTQAVPVHPAKLGAGLEVYKTLKPALHTFRLYTRFENGTQVTINRLSLELVKRIVDSLINSAREERESLWLTGMTCFEGRYSRTSHLSQTQLQDLEQEWGADYYENVEEYLKDDKIDEVCSQRQSDWMSQTSSSHFMDEAPEDLN
jgi:hypothetical protein